MSRKAAPQAPGDLLLRPAHSQVLPGVTSGALSPVEASDSSSVWGGRLLSRQAARLCSPRHCPCRGQRLLEFTRFQLTSHLAHAEGRGRLSLVKSKPQQIRPHGPGQANTTWMGRGLHGLPSWSEGRARRRGSPGDTQASAGPVPTAGAVDRGCPQTRAPCPGRGAVSRWTWTDQVPGGCTPSLPCPVCPEDQGLLRVYYHCCSSSGARAAWPRAGQADRLHSASVWG